MLFILDFQGFEFLLQPGKLDFAVFLPHHFLGDVLEKQFCLLDEFLGVEETLGEVVFG